MEKLIKSKKSKATVWKPPQHKNTSDKSYLQHEAENVRSDFWTASANWSKPKINDKYSTLSLTSKKGGAKSFIATESSTKWSSCKWTVSVSKTGSWSFIKTSSNTKSFT